MFTVGETDETIEPFPVATITPWRPFAWVTKSGPTAEFVVELGGHPVENGFGGTGFVVIGPTANDGIEFANQSSLRTTAIITDKLFQVGQMTFDGFLGGSNQSLEINIPLEGSGFVSAHVMLPDVEAQKIKPDPALVIVEGVANVGFGGVELQSHPA